MSIYKFPENFKWGSATSAHQVEGNNRNDWTEWEIKTAKSKAQIAKRKEWPEHVLNSYPNPLQEENYISGKACDSYNRYEEDFDIAKRLNQNIHRFSIEWSRIESEEGRFNEKEMQHYINVVKALRDRGIEPMITLWHFTKPIWFAKKGGFLDHDSPEYFTRYAKYVVANLPEVQLWITFNEATTIYSGFSYLKGFWPPQHKNIFEWRRVNKNIVRSHIQAYKEIKKIHNNPPVDSVSLGVQPRGNFEVEPLNKDTSHNVEVGIVESNTYNISGNNFYEKLIGRVYDYYRNLYFWSKAFPHYDFIGLNYYHIDRRVPGSYKTLPEQEWRMENMDWEIYPKGSYYCLNNLKKFKKPVYITENGIVDSTDQRRPKFIKDHLYWIWEAIQDGVDVRGYMYWSLLDNFEWHHGFTPRFGLVEVDYRTFERRIRPSAWEYTKICLTNQLETD